MSKEAMKLALEWANKHGEIVFAGGDMTAVKGMNNWVLALRELLAQPAEQQPYGWVRPNPSFSSGVFSLGAQCPPGWAGSAVAVYKQNERLRRNDESMEDNDDK